MRQAQSLEHNSRRAATSNPGGCESSLPGRVEVPTKFEGARLARTQPLTLRIWYTGTALMSGSSKRRDVHLFEHPRLLPHRMSFLAISGQSTNRIKNDWAARRYRRLRHTVRSRDVRDEPRSLNRPNLYEQSCHRVSTGPIANDNRIAALAHMYNEVSNYDVACPTRRRLRRSAHDAAYTSTAAWRASRPAARGIKMCHLLRGMFNPRYRALSQGGRGWAM